MLLAIGGRRAQQASAFKKGFPHLPGRVIVQDRPEVTDSAVGINEVEFMIHDFEA